MRKLKKILILMAFQKSIETHLSVSEMFGFSTELSNSQRKILITLLILSA